METFYCVCSLIIICSTFFFKFVTLLLKDLVILKVSMNQNNPAFSGEIVFLFIGKKCRVSLKKVFMPNKTCLDSLDAHER